MNNATIALIDAAFEMSAATKREYPKEGTPEFFAITDVAHRLECACIAYKKSLAQRPLKSGSVREAAEWTSKKFADEYQPPSVDSDLTAGDERRLAVIIAQAFAGFVPREEYLKAVQEGDNFCRQAGDLKEALEQVERFNNQLSKVANERNAAQADNAKLREVLEKINRKSSHDFDDDSIYTLSKSALQSFRAAEEKL